MSDLLRERLGPSSTYVESLIAIQRAYINTNHPNFLGAAAAMSSVINSKQEKEKKAAMAEERRKRERRRLKESAGVNGVDTPEDEDEEEKTQGMALRQHQHRDQHRAVAAGMENGGGNMGGFANGGAPGSTKDSFLNYFFGKEGQLPPGANIGSSTTRHVSHSTEPSFSQSIRRSEHRPGYQESEHDLDRSRREFDHNTGYVSLSLSPCEATRRLTPRSHR